jgi:hypothetical protein
MLLTQDACRIERQGPPFRTLHENEIRASQMNATRVYLSGQFEDAPVLRTVRDELIRAGCRVTSRWLNGDSSTPATAHAGEEGAAARLAAIAYQDFEDIRGADVVVVFNPPAACNAGRGGRHVETGYALALGKKVVVVGARGNVFHWMPEVTVVEEWAGLLTILRPGNET